jgi:cytochrome oxidase assembly protein ShyY1
VNGGAGFRAPAWAWLLTAAVAGLFAALGQWQLGKGLTKARMAEATADRASEPEIISSALGAPFGMHVRRAQATGVYLADQQLLLDGQSNRHRPGYRVWTPLLLPLSGAAVMVDRGWIPHDRAAFDGSAPAGTQTVTGAWRALPQPGLRLEGTVNCPEPKAFPAVVLYPTPDDLECLLSRPVVGGLLLMDAEAPAGFVREWTDFGFPPERHYGYAFQWFALAIVVVIVFVVVNRRKRGPDTGTRGQA